MKLSRSLKCTSSFGHVRPHFLKIEMEFNDLQYASAISDELDKAVEYYEDYDPIYCSMESQIRQHEYYGVFDLMNRRRFAC